MLGDIGDAINDAVFDDDEACGCTVVPLVLGAVTIDTHHHQPDDDAPHTPTLDCPCRPWIRPWARLPAVGLAVIHVDQDDGDDGPWWPPTPTTMPAMPIEP